MTDGAQPPAGCSALQAAPSTSLHGPAALGSDPPAVQPEAGTTSNQAYLLIVLRLWYFAS